MSDTDEVLGLLDDLLRLAAGTSASTIEVEADDVAVSLTRTPTVAAAPSADAGASAPAPAEPAKVRSTGVGIFSAAKEWSAGDAVTKGTVLGAVQSLGAMTDVVAPTDGVLRDVLVTAGAPVEYGQALFAIEEE
jgi:acetyl-CoA carboxylase biotin carboxyl carrier protein